MSEKKLSGFIAVNKPSGMTSSDVVVKVRGILRSATGDKKIKVGHLGTLDPNGAGVLPIAVGAGTKLFEYTTKKIKKYRAGICFGKTTDTLDSYGGVTETSDVLPTAEELKAVLPELTGEVMQVPPAYSSLSVGGVKAYKLARRGGEVVIAARPVKIFDISVQREIEPGHYVLDIVCEGGTYIRSLVRDIAARLGALAYMSFIIRTKSGEFLMENSVNLEEFALNPTKFVMPIETVTSGFERFDVPAKFEKQVRCGVKVKIGSPEKGPFAVYVSNELLGIGETENEYLIVKTRLENA